MYIFISMLFKDINIVMKAASLAEFIIAELVTT